MKVINEIVRITNAYKGKYDWLDRRIDEVVENAIILFKKLPQDEIFDNMEIDFSCEDHHDGYICEIYVSYPNELYDGLCIRIEDLGYDITNYNADDFGRWEIDSDTSIDDIALGVYTTFKNASSNKEFTTKVSPIRAFR